MTTSNAEDGVALAVEKLILAEVHAAEIPLDLLNERARHALMGNLGIQYTYASEERVEATMPVDHRTRQPFGILHGGATLALADRRRTRLHDNLRTRRNCRGNASQWKPHFLCTRGRYCKGSRYYPAQRTFIPYLECGCIYFDKQIGFLHTGGE